MTTDSTPAADNLIVRMFDAWNAMMRGDEALTAENFARFYTPDARLIVNGALRSADLPAMAAHYRAIQARCRSVQMVLPVERQFATDAYAFVHCRTHVVTDAGEQAEEAMAYAQIDNDRISLLRVISLSV